MALTETQVSQLYTAIFNRASEGAGNKYWQTQGDLAEVANKMLATPDAQDYFGDALSDDKAFVEWIYKNTFNKTYADDPEGIDYWVQNLKDGATRGDVVANMVTAATAPENAGDAQDQFNNRVTVSNYLAEHFEGENLPVIMPDYKVKLGFDGELKVDNTGASVVQAIEIIDANYTDGKTITLTPNIDKGPDFAGTDASDTWIGDSSTIGTADAISDPSVIDHDKFEITATGNLPAFTVVNVENIDVKFDTLGGNSVNAAGFSHGGDGTTITVSSDRFGFSGAATINSLGSNKAVAGENITNLTVSGITNGTVDAGKANTVNATTLTGAENLNLIVNGDVAVTGLATTGDLNIEATADSVVDVTNAGFKNSDIKGDADVTIKSDVAEVTGETITNSGNGTVTLELTDNANIDMTNMDVNKAILDVAYTSTATINKNLEVTAKQAGNTATFTAPPAAGLGGSNSVELTLNLTQAATTDTYTMNNIGQTNINAEKGGTIAAITDTTGSVKLNAGDDTVVTAATLTGQALEIDGASTGKVTLTSIDAQAIIANDFTKDLSITEAAAGAANNIAIIGSQAKNSVVLATTTATASVKTQDDVDTITADSITTGKLTVDTADGNDTVTATGMTTSNATFDLGAGDDSLTIKNAAGGEATVNAGDGKDTVLVLDGTAGKMTINGDAGDDIVDLQAKITGGVNVGGGKLASGADVTVNGGDGNDIIKINETSADAPTITIDGGNGSDIVDVRSAADFTASTLSMSNVETLKIDTAATFSDDQLNDQTFEVMSGTAAVDILNVVLDASLATDTPNTTNLSDLKFSTSSATKVEYININATASASDDTIKGAHNTANVIDLGAASGKETVQLFADGIGTTINNLQGGSPQTDLAVTNLTGIDTTKTSFDIAVISNFETADDSLILGPAATATNYTEIAIDFDSTAGAPNAGIEDYLLAAIAQANTDMAANTDLVYEYVYDDGANGADADAWLLWDSDGNHVVDAAILLVGVESSNDGSGFAASDIVAAS